MIIFKNMYELLVEKTFDAAHFLEGYDGKCSRMHGYTTKADLCYGSKTDEKFGMLMDFKDMKASLNSGRTTGSSGVERCFRYQNLDRMFGEVFLR